ncbi:MAG: hypothetical protein V1702_04440 [Candidatus Woesearchaeota archaeon]
MALDEAIDSYFGPHLPEKMKIPESKAAAAETELRTGLVDLLNRALEVGLLSQSGVQKAIIGYEIARKIHHGILRKLMDRIDLAHPYAVAIEIIEEGMKLRAGDYPNLVLPDGLIPAAFNHDSGEISISEESTLERKRGLEDTINLIADAYSELSSCDQTEKENFRSCIDTLTMRPGEDYKEEYLMRSLALPLDIFMANGIIKLADRDQTTAETKKSDAPIREGNVEIGLLKRGAALYKNISVIQIMAEYREIMGDTTQPDSAWQKHPLHPLVKSERQKLAVDTMGEAEKLKGIVRERLMETVSPQLSPRDKEKEERRLERILNYINAASAIYTETPEFTMVTPPDYGTIFDGSIQFSRNYVAITKRLREERSETWLEKAVDKSMKLQRNVMMGMYRRFLEPHNSRIKSAELSLMRAYTRSVTYYALATAQVNNPLHITKGL